MTVPPISPQWLRKGNFVVKALSPSVMWPPTFGETPMSAVVSGSAPRAIGRAFGDTIGMSAVRYSPWTADFNLGDQTVSFHYRSAASSSGETPA